MTAGQHVPGICRDQPGARLGARLGARYRQALGFTLVELLVAIAVLGILAALALPAYRMYVERAQLAQILVQLDEIATAVRIEQAQGERALQQGAALGKAPPRLPSLSDSVFNEPGGIRLLLIRAPAGFFPSTPDRTRYALIADASGAASPTRLHELAHLLAFQESDKLWLTATQLAFPLAHDGAFSAATSGSSSGTSGTGSSGSTGSGTVAGPTASGGSTPNGGAGSTPGNVQTPVQTKTTAWAGTAQAGGGGTWSCSAQATIRGTDGSPLGGSVGAHVRVTTLFTGWDGTPGQRGWDDVMNLQAGQGSISLANLNAQTGRGEVITGCRFEVTGVDYYWPTQPVVRWDGTAASVEISKP